MLNEGLSRFALFGIIKYAISINTIVSVLKDSVTKNRIRVIVVMIPNQRNSFAVVMLEGILLNDSSVSTKEIVSGCIARKVTIDSHFELPPCLKLD